MAQEFSASGLAYKIRTQFSFTADDPTLSCILNGIASMNISITGYLQTKGLRADGCGRPETNLVRLVVGSPDGETEYDLAGVEDVLDELHVKFQEKPVIQVLLIAPVIPGILNGIYRALWCKDMVYASYIGEETRLFFDVADVCKALMILSEVPLNQCPLRCHIC